MQIEFFRLVDDFLRTARPKRPASGVEIKVSAHFNTACPTELAEVERIARDILETLDAWWRKHDPDLRDDSAIALRRGFQELVELARAREISIDDAIGELQVGVAAIARWAHARGMRPA